MTVVASYGMVLCGNSSDDLNQRYRGRIEKVKFGVPINEAFAHDIPATLLVLLLKVNKEGPQKKDIWRAPGNQAQKFLSKLPGGIFGVENEQILFNSALQNTDLDKQRQVFYRIFCSLPVPSQHLLVLLFGTFRTVADSSETFGTKMNPDAIAISVAPSLFHSCIHDGRQVKFEDVQRFKLASEVVKTIINSFGHTNLFPRECYEFYARITGRTLRVDENWLFTFQYPSRTRHGGGAEPVVLPDSPYDEPTTLAASISHRLSSSVGEVLHQTGAADLESCESDFLRPLTSCGGDSSRSFTYLEWVHENQARRMRSRSEWFLSPTIPSKSSSHPGDCDLFTLKALPGSFSFTAEDDKKLDIGMSNSLFLQVLHQTGAADLESCESDFLRPLTSCGGDSSRSFTYLEWVHENQARRMRSRSEWFLSPTIPSKSSSHPGDCDLFTLKALPGSFSFTAEDDKKLGDTSDTIPLLSKKSYKILSHVERLNLQAKKSRQPFAERTCSTSSPKNNCSCAMSASGLPSSCGHSLDSQEPPVLPSQRVSGKTMYSRSLAHSIGGETWLMEVISDEIWKKKRSVKKKH
ncbi:RhoGAP domain protein [Ostertagia ostertagi]